MLLFGLAIAILAGSVKRVQQVNKPLRAITPADAANDLSVDLFAVAIVVFAALWVLR